MKRVLIQLILLSLIACKETPKPKQESKVIVTTTPVLDHFVGRLTHGLTGVSHKLALQTQGKCLHDHALSVEELRTLCSASLIIANGIDFEPFLDKVLAQCPQVPVVKVFEGCPLMELPKSHEELKEHDHHHAHKEHEMQNPQGQKFDPHAWFGSQQVDCMLQNISSAVGKLDSNQNAVLSAASQKTRQQIQNFWGSLKTQYAHLKGTEVVVFHSSYNYLMQELGMKAVASVSEEQEESAPSAKQIASLVGAIKKHQVGILLAGESELPPVATMVAMESGARLVPMLTMLESIDSNDTLAYERILSENLRRIAP